MLSWSKSGHLACIPKQSCGTLHQERIWPVAFKVAKDHVFICSVSGADRKALKPEGPQWRVYGVFFFFASLSPFLGDLIMREKCAVSSF